MLILIITLSCIYIFCAAFLLFGIWKAPYGFEDETGFHLAGASRFPHGENGLEDAVIDDESAGDACKSGAGAPLRRKSRISRKTPRICRRSSPRKRAQFGTS